jgi:hypothetical protein
MKKDNQGYCSWCFEEVAPTLIKAHKLTRNLHKCPKCEMRLTRCRACANYARWDACEVRGKRIKEHHQFCSQHRGDIPSFDRLDTELNDPSEYLTIYEKREINWAKVTKIGVSGVAAGGITVPLSIVAAPAIGGAIGSHFFRLSGAAAVSKGLAVLSGGSVASGGLGMGGGTFLVTALGVGMGGTLGGVIANSYFGNIKGFHISKKRDGRYPAIVTVNGFLTEGNQDTSDWASVLPDKYDSHAWFHVDWEAKTLTSLGKMAGTSGTSVILLEALTKAAKTAIKQAARKMRPASGALGVVELARNPWNVAMMKSHMTGVVLANVLSRCAGKRFVLFGHSLGARAIFELLRTLNAESHVVEEAHLFGGAVGNAREEWREIKSKMEGPIFNYHSNNDDVLKFMYKVGTFFQSDAIGRHPIEGVAGIINIDVSTAVPGHMHYKTGKVKPYVGCQVADG